MSLVTRPVNIVKLIGLKIVDIRGWEGDPKKDKTPRRDKLYQPMWILFNDKKTYIELEEQDPYDFHDCSSIARYIRIRQDEERWKNIMDDLSHYPKVNSDI